MDRPSIHLRLPRDLLDQLRAQAERQGVSLNTLLATLLAGSIGWGLGQADDEQPESWMPQQNK